MDGAQTAQVAQAAKEPVTDLGPRKVKSLTDILGDKPSTQKRRPTPFNLTWVDGTRIVPCARCKASGSIPSPEHGDSLITCPECGGAKEFQVPNEFELRVTCHYPENAYVCQVEWLELSKSSLTPETNERGEETYPNEDIDTLHLCQSMVEEPVWLKNKSALRQFKEGTPSPVFAALRRKLMNIGGLDADFFADSQDFVTPALLNRLASESRSASASPQTKPSPSMTETSPPSGTTTGSDTKKTASPASPTTSGSSASTPTTEPPTASPPLIQSTVT